MNNPPDRKASTTSTASLDDATKSTLKSADQIMTETEAKEKQLRSYLQDKSAKLREEEERLQAFKTELEKVEAPSRVYVEDYRKKIANIDKEIKDATDLYYKLVKQTSEAKTLMEEKMELKSKLSDKLMRVVKEVEQKREAKLAELYSRMNVEKAETKEKT
eukprot:GFYU01031658.1.p1 GENE.GFYU01031658.1~~GFYU01031658.1.p1  ORF type:complete len:161 (-),score=43.45 GFYU01031658.1:78-560(-)